MEGGFDALSSLTRTLSPLEARSLVSERDDDGATLLHAAAAAGHAPACEQLLALGADPCARDVESGATALHTALHRGHLGAALVLLCHGAPLEDAEGGWAARRAARPLHSWLARPLAPPPAATLRGGCLDKGGASPLEFAQEAVAPLLRAMAAQRAAALRALEEGGGGGCDGDGGSGGGSAPALLEGFARADWGGAGGAHLAALAALPPDVSLSRHAPPPSLPLTPGGEVVAAPTLAVPPTAGAVAEPGWAWRCSLFSWGEDHHQLGYAVGTGSAALPKAVELQPCAGGGGALPPPFPGAPPLIVALSAGAAHSLLLSAEGEVFAFGSDAGGRLGLCGEEGGGGGGGGGRVGSGARTVVRPVPLPFFPAARLRVVGVSAGTRHSLALVAGGALFSWGDARSGALGVGALAEGEADVGTPRRVGGALRCAAVAAFSAGASHSAAA